MHDSSNCETFQLRESDLGQPLMSLSDQEWHQADSDMDGVGVVSFGSGAGMGPYDRPPPRPGTQQAQHAANVMARVLAGRCRPCSGVAVSWDEQFAFADWMLLCVDWVVEQIASSRVLAPLAPGVQARRGLAREICMDAWEHARTARKIYARRAG
eukprot:8402174-Pyramimonas_sp.AAC.1